MPAPVFINCRDRLAPLQELVAWLERAGVEEIYLLDNESVHEPLLEYYRSSPHHVLHLGGNYGKLALWEAPGVFELAKDREFVYTDCDIIPEPDCPLDALDLFSELLAKYRGVHKSGFGIRWDDIPDHYPHKEIAVAWERAQWDLRLERGVYLGKIDTGFAMYRPNTGVKPHWAARTAKPYWARHDSYYIDLENPRDEDRVYEARMAESRAVGELTHWASHDLLDSARTKMEMLGTSCATRVKWRLTGPRKMRRG